jgi:hypothetical protein
MKQQVKYQLVSVPGKLRFELKLFMDDSNDKTEFISNINGDKYTTVSLYPIMSLTIIRLGELNESGIRTKVPYNPNDTLSMGRYNYPIFVNELNTIHKDFKTPELYSYTNKRLEMNEELASKFRRVFMVGNTVVEMVPVVIIQPDENKVEGVKIKFNNEQSSVLLTLNDMESLLFTMERVNIDSITMDLYNSYIKTGVKNHTVDASSFAGAKKVDIDIIPKDNTI